MTYTFTFLLQENRYREIYVSHLWLHSHVGTQLTENIVKIFCLRVYSNYILDYWSGKLNVECTTFA
jgi:hypothetical protein